MLASFLSLIFLHTYWFMHTTSQVKSVPINQVFTQSINRNNAVFNSLWYY
jgi:hypothetical protein